VTLNKGLSFVFLLGFKYVLKAFIISRGMTVPKSVS
jgi:hypothetical protein